MKNAHYNFSFYFHSLIIGLLLVAIIACNNNINDECQYNFPLQQYVKDAIPYSEGQTVNFKTQNGEMINLVVERKEEIMEMKDECVEWLSIKLKNRGNKKWFLDIITTADHSSNNDAPRDIIQMNIPFEFINPQSSIQYDLTVLKDGFVIPVILEDSILSSYEPVESYEFHDLFEFNGNTYSNTLDVTWAGFGTPNEQAIKKIYYSTEKGLIYAENFASETITLVNY